MIPDSGASNHSVDGELIPRLCGSMKNYKKLKEPKIIVTAVNKEVVFGDISSIRLGGVFLFVYPP